jgi:ubiquinone/menaquinone biosynthesis C-methylase UbiE
VSTASEPSRTGFLAQRYRQPEWMDEPGVDPKLLADSLRFIRRINSALGYTRGTISHLERFSRTWKPGDTIRIIDFATGSADVPLAIVRWARQRNLEVRVTGVDLHETTCGNARDATRDEPRITIVRADVLDLPFDAGSFDYAITSLFLHHLSNDDAAKALAAMDRVARRGVIAGDLIRNRRAYFWISLFTLLSNPMVRHDAKVSVAQAFNEPEARVLCRQAELDYLSYHLHPGHRFILAGEKPAVQSDGGDSAGRVEGGLDGGLGGDLGSGRGQRSENQPALAGVNTRA